MNFKSVLAFTLVSVLTLGLMFCYAQDKHGADAKVIDFTLKSIDGKDIKLSEFYKGKVLVMKFGATWCPPCNKEIEVLNKIVETYKDKVAVIEVNLREAKDKVAKHCQEKGVAYTMVLDTDGAVAAQYGVKSIPHILIANDKDVRTFIGYKDFDKMKEAIDAMLPQEPKKEEPKKEEAK